MGKCLTPYYVKMNKEEEIPVRCGRCPECTKHRVSTWSFRLMQHSKVAKSSQFITLTYDTNHIPITQNGFMALRKRDLQLFFKRLRKAHGAGHDRISYYAVGEYGGRTQRPHYHIILFNAKIELIQNAWQLGQVHYGQLTEASVGYTLKYICKPGKIPMHRNDDRQPEFPLMSKGIGLNYLTSQMRSWHLADLENRAYCNIEDGKKISMPRYYKKKLYDEDQQELVNHAQKKKFQEEEAKEIEKQGDQYEWNQEQFKRQAFRKQIFNSKKRDNL